MTFQKILETRCEDLRNSVGRWPLDDHFPVELLAYTLALFDEIDEAINAGGQDSEEMGERKVDIAARSTFLRLAAACGIDGKTAWEWSRQVVNGIENKNWQEGEGKALDEMRRWAKRNIAGAMSRNEFNDQLRSAINVVVHSLVRVLQVGLRSAALEHIPDVRLRPNTMKGPSQGGLGL